MPTAGKTLLNSAGKRILRADGKTQLAVGAACDCDCTLICFQEWIAFWSCPDQAWTGPVTDNRLCLPPDTSTDWVKIASDASGCEYRKYVPYDPAHSCSVNGDCGAGLGDTATPDLPFGGGVPPDCVCCIVCEPCELIPDPHCCDPCQTPDTVHAMILAAVASANCSYEVSGACRVYKLDVSGLVGRSFPLPYSSNCCYEDTFDVTAWVKMLRCIGDCTGCTCDPSEDITTSTSVQINYCISSGLMAFTWLMTTPDQGGPFPIINHTNPLSDVVPVPCCKTFTLTGGSLDGTEDMLTIAVTSASVSPCGGGGGEAPLSPSFGGGPLLLLGM